MHIFKQANERHGAFIDHSGNIIDSRTGAAISLGIVERDEPDENGLQGDGSGEGEDEGVVLTDGYSFFDSVSLNSLPPSNPTPISRKSAYDCVYMAIGRDRQASNNTTQASAERW
jgi:hypothetical protein